MNDVTKFKTTGQWLFWGLTAISLILFVVVGFFIYQYSGQKDVSVTLEAPNDILLGAPFEIDINLENNASKDLEDVAITLLLPEGAVATEESGDQRFVTKEIGPVTMGQTASVTIPIILYKTANTVYPFKATASYTFAGATGRAILNTEEKISITAKDPAIRLDIESPQQVLNNSAFAVKINYANESNYNFSNAAITLLLPANVRLTSAEPAPATSTQEWVIRDLPKGSGGAITLRLVATGPDESFFEVKTRVSDNDNLVAEKTASIGMAQSPLALAIETEGRTSIAYPGQAVRYIVTYRNNTDVAMNDVIVKARLTGTMLNLPTLRTNGFFNSSNNTITWNAASIPDLRVVRPGSAGSVEFEAPLKEQYPIRRLSDKNFTIVVDADISSPTIPYYVASDKTTAVARHEIKVGGRLGLLRRAAVKDSSGFDNKGPVPLRVNVPTQATIRWILTNYSTDMRTVTLKASTQAGVRLTGKIKSNVASAPVWNERTGEISWTIDRIPATKGVIGAPVEASFQIEAIPNITQINQPMPLISEITLVAIDDFTNTELRAAAPSVESDDLDDAINTMGAGVVVP